QEERSHLSYLSMCMCVFVFVCVCVCVWVMGGDDPINPAGVSGQTVPEVSSTFRQTPSVPVGDLQAASVCSLKRPQLRVSTLFSVSVSLSLSPSPPLFLSRSPAL